MKKSLLFLSLLSGGLAVAQTSSSGFLHLKNNQSAPYYRYGRMDRHNTQAPSGNQPELNGMQKSTTITPVGISTYQLQSNAAVQNRITDNGDGTISATWSFSDEPNSSSWSDRGTGYVYFDGTSWSAAPTTRIEPVRTGWPSMLVLDNGSEVIITHNTASSNLHISRRPTKGTGTWTHDASSLVSTAPLGNFWPRATSSGNNVHVISITNPIDDANGNAPVFFHGQQGAITYSRSTDGGVTWPILHTIPAAHDSSNYYGFDGDSYDIDARGNTVAYVIGGFTNDLFLMKSTDNGSTWTKTVIMQFAIPFFDNQLTDPNNDGVIDTLQTNDGAVSVLLDDNGMAHVWVGNMRMMNDDDTDADIISYFPGTSGLLYWNEGMGAVDPIVLADLEDIDGDSALGVAASAWGTYQVALTSQPSSGIKGDNTIYLTYAGLIENSDDGTGKNVRNIYYMESSDHGANWSNPRRVNPDDFMEQVYASVVPTTDNQCVSMIYQSDIAAGHGVGDDNVDNASNISETTDQVYVCFDPLSFAGTEILDLSGKVTLYPNPAEGMVNLSSLNTIDRVEIYTVLGSMVGAYTPNSMQPVLNVSNLESGIYMVNVYSGNTKVTKRLIKK